MIEIKLDIDGPLTPTQVLRLLRDPLEYVFRFIFPDFGRLQLDSIVASRTTHSHGWHVLIIVTNQIPNSKDRIFIQLLLLSDYRRELQDWERTAWLQDWNRLFTEKVQEIKTRKRRRFYRLRKALGLNPYEIQETGRYKTVGKEIRDPQLSKKLRRIIRETEKKPPIN